MTTPAVDDRAYVANVRDTVLVLESATRAGVEVELRLAIRRA